MDEIRLEDIERLGYQQLSIVHFSWPSDTPYVKHLIQENKPDNAVAYWLLDSINQKTGETYVGYVKSGIEPGN